MSTIPDSFMEIDGVRYRVYFDESTQQFESVRAKAEFFITGMVCLG